jgi:hypothetical protein
MKALSRGIVLVTGMAVLRLGVPRVAAAAEHGGVRSVFSQGAGNRALQVDPTDQRAMGYLARAQKQLTRTREILGNTR